MSNNYPLSLIGRPGHLAAFREIERLSRIPVLSNADMREHHLQSFLLGEDA